MRTITRYRYIDETGDTGLRFDKSSSTHFVVGIVSGDWQRITAAARKVRDQLHWHEDQEFKFSDSDDAAKTLYLSTMSRMQFEAHIIVFDKRKIGRLIGRDFYGHLVGLALEDVIEVLNGTNLVLDESFKGRSKKRTFRTELRRRLTQPGGEKVLRGLSYRSSHSDEMLQLADMIVGAVARAHRRQDDKYRRIVAARIVSEREYP